MNEAEDDFSLLPTDLDLLRLQQLENSNEEGRVESENEVWVAIRYATSPLKAKSWQWCSWSLLVNCPGIPPKGSPYEFKRLAALLEYLKQLEGDRVKNRSKGE